MKKTLSFLLIVLVIISGVVLVSGQPRKRPSIIGGAGGAGSLARRNKTVTRRNGQRGRYVRRNGKRIWVPQGSPVIGNRRAVVER